MSPLRQLSNAQHFDLIETIMDHIATNYEWQSDEAIEASLDHMLWFSMRLNEQAREG